MILNRFLINSERISNMHAKGWCKFPEIERSLAKYSLKDYENVILLVQ